MHCNTFLPKERLKHKKDINRLFADGQSKVFFPLLVYWLALDHQRTQIKAQFAVSVPKSKFKSAVKRNLLKRRIREAYRLSKADFYQGLNLPAGSMLLMVIYIHDDLLDYHTIRTALQKALAFIAK